MDNSFNRIKKKFKSSSPGNYWGDDYDVRYYLISKMNQIKNCSIVDIGGGIGVVSSEMDNTNEKYNLDLSINDLKLSNATFSKSINNLCGEMTHLPIKDNSVDYVISCHLIELAKYLDIKNNSLIKGEINTYPTLEKILKEIYRILKPHGIAYITTPNNAYYKSKKLDYYELKNSLKNYFNDFEIYFYNVFPHTRRYRKLSLSNVIPKILSKIKDRKRLLNSLLKKDQGEAVHSVSFFIEAKKS